VLKLRIFIVVRNAGSPSMNFEQEIAEIFSTLKEGGFSIIEHRTDYARFQSKLITLVVSYSSLEHTFSIFLGRNNGEMNELSDKVFLNVFGTNFKQLSGATFAGKIISFLQNEGSAIPQNDLSKISEVEAYSRKAANEYTSAIINRQNLEAADKAWNESNYRDFISHLDKVAEDALPKAYGLKRKIALRKIEEGS
jgi:hypothetical protein